MGGGGGGLTKGLIRDGPPPHTPPPLNSKSLGKYWVRQQRAMGAGYSREQNALTKIGSLWLAPF